MTEVSFYYPSRDLILSASLLDFWRLPAKDLDCWTVDFSDFVRHQSLYESLHPQGFFKGKIESIFVFLEITHTRIFFPKRDAYTPSQLVFVLSRGHLGEVGDVVEFSVTKMKTGGAA